MDLKRIKLTVEINLDALPGAMHTAESAEEILQQILWYRLGHYNPVVAMIED